MTEPGLSGGRVLRSAGELAIIVIGVLMALAVDSWRQGFEERSREEEYLAQLLSDAQENARILEGALSEETIRLEQLMAIEDALIDSVTISRESALGWTAEGDDNPTWYSDPRLRLGTITSLLAAGDFRLIRDARVRNALIAYAGQMEADLAEVDRWVDELPHLYEALSDLAYQDFFAGAGECGACQHR